MYKLRKDWLVRDCNRIVKDQLVIRNVKGSSDGTAKQFK